MLGHMTSCCNMADRYKWFGIVFSSLLFAFGEGLQCQSSLPYFKVAVDDSVVIDESTSISVPISRVNSHLTCLYYDGTPCSSGEPPISWHGHNGNSHCVDVVTNGEPISMYAVDLSVSGLAPGDRPVCNGPGGTGRTVFLSSGDSLAQDYCFCMTQICPTPSSSASSSSHTPSPSTPSTSSTTSSDSPPSTPKSSSSQSVDEVNPLIYTVTAVALLGTASIVAMVSCCIRQRRAMLRRREFLFGRDYLDFMNDRDFTQLTANQLAASLHEAPPTYQQSEEIERQLKDPEDDEDTPPPLPPRNMPRNSTNTTEVEPIPSDHSEDESGTQDILRNLI